MPALLDQAFARELPEPQFDFPAGGIDAFAKHPDLMAYLHWRTEPVTSLTRLCAASDVPTLLIDYEGSWWGGVDPAAIAPLVDGFLYCAYRTRPGRIAPLLSEARRLLGPDKTLIAGFLLFHPEVASREDLKARVAEAAPLVDGVNFYNLGTVPPARLDWIRTALT